MSLNCVIGEAIYNKDKYIYNKAADLENQGFFPVIFVPSQARMTAEEAYMKYTGKSGMVNTYITTLSRYILKTLDSVKLNKEYITDETKRMYIKQIINENRGILTLFSNVIDKPSFVDLVISYIDSIKKEDIDISKIDDMTDINNLTKEKLKEICNICQVVEERLNEKYIDSLDILEIFCEHISKESKGLKNTEIFFHGYNNFSKREFDVIKTFLKLGLNVTVSLTLPSDMISYTENPGGIFEIAYETYGQLTKLAKECKTSFNNVMELDKIKTQKDIEYLIQNIFSARYSKYDKRSENILLRLEKNSNYEIEEIAKDIICKTRKDNNLRFRNFAIYTNNFEEYEFCIKRIFADYGIAYSFDDTSEVEFSNFAIYLLTLLKIIQNGIDINSLFVLLKTGLFDITKEDLNYFENYVLEFGIKGYMLSKNFKRNNKEDSLQDTVYDLDRLNILREKIIKYITEFGNEINYSMTAKEMIEKIYNHLIENKIVDRYEVEIDNTTDLSVKQSDLKRQVITVIYDVFDNISMVCGNDKISLKTFIEMFEFGIKDKTIKTIPMTVDQVEICDINKTRILPKKYVYFIGAYENGLPSTSNEDVMFSDKELKALKEKQIELKQDSITRTNMALFNVYLALATAEEKIKISMPSSKITGEPLRMGIILNEIKRLFNVNVTGNITGADVERLEFDKSTDRVVFRKLLEDIVKVSNEDVVDKKELQRLYNIYEYFANVKEEKKYSDILEYSRKDDNLSEEVLSELYKNDLNSSVSKLETFKRCPFSYYANYILNIKPLKRYKMTVMDMGTLMHDVLEQFSKWLMERSYLWQQVVTEEKINLLAKEKIDTIVDKIFAEKYIKYKDNNRYIVLKSGLKRKMFKIISIIATSFNQSEFKPLGYEIEFRDGGLYSPIEVNLENGKTMHLIGKIDRVDTACINDKIYVRIVDYKSSNRTISLNDIKEGISLQLMTYMSALVNNGKNIDVSKEIVPAAINYFSLKTNIKRISEYEQDEEKINKQLIKEMKLKGIYLSDVKVLEGLDRKYKDTNSSFIDVNSRNINDKNKVISEEEFRKECKDIQEILKEIGKQITQGITKIKPKKCNGKMPCEYCEYMNICRKDIRA